MEQHEKITGYRTLTEHEIGLMNDVKAFEARGVELMEKIRTHLRRQREDAAGGGPRALIIDQIETGRINNAEPMRWLSIGRTDLQTACMALVRAVAQPRTPE